MTLKAFDGQEVRAATIAITNAGDGLSEALKVNPMEMHHGERHYVVLECDVTQVKFVPVDKDDPAGDLIRVHTLKAGMATLVDKSVVDGVLAEQRRKLDEAKGIPQLPFTGDDESSGGEADLDPLGD